MTAVPFTFVLPVKVLAVAKSRLGADPGARAALALAMAVDVAAAARAVGRVLVVTDDPQVAAALSDPAVPDLPDAGLSAAVAHGAQVAAERWPGDGVIALAADLPAISAASLHDVVAGMRRSPASGSWVVADAGGIGTAVLATAPGTTMVPAYEGPSFAAHRAAGAADLTPYAAPGLRRDVDTVADLTAAIALGVGPATSAALELHRDAWRAAGLP